MSHALSKLKSILKSLLRLDVHYRGYKNIDGWLTPAEAHGLYRLAASLETGANVLEIGSWKGKSTFCIGKGLKEGVIYCIDPFNADGEVGSKEIYAKSQGGDLLTQFRTNLSTISSSVQIKTLVGYSSAFLNLVPPIDLLFIDGDHSIEGCRFDFENFSSRLKVGGYVAFHDYDATREDLGPTWVVEKLLKPNAAYARFGSFDSLLVFIKTA